MFISRQRNSFFITLGTVSIPLTILSRCFCASQGCLSSIYRPDGETYNQAHICPSRHHPFFFFFFSAGRATFSSLWQRKRKCFLTVLNSSVSTVHSEKVCLFMSDVCLVCFSPSIMPEGHFPPSSLVVEGGKEALSHWWAYFRQASLVISLPHFLLIFQMYLWDM